MMFSRDETPSDRFPVVVIGGGLAGLFAALHLADRGVTPLVLEADQHWAGGRLSGGEREQFTHEGRVWSFPTEHGIHALWGGYVNMRAALARFVPDLALVPSVGEVWINRVGYDISRVEAGSAVRGGWLPAPLHYLQLLLRPMFWVAITPFDILSLPGFLVSVLFTVGFDPLRERRALDGLMMHAYFGGWTRNLRSTFVGVGVNLLAAPQERIALTAFVAALRFYTMLRRADWHPYFLSDDADAALIAPLVARLHALGGRIVYGATAERLEQVEGGWRVIVSDEQRRGRRTVHAEHVILATSAPAAERLLRESPDTAERTAALRFPGGLRTITVRLWFSRAPAAPIASGMLTGDFVFDNFFWLDQMQPAFRRWREATGGSVVELHLYGADPIVVQADAVLISRAADDVQAAFPELRGTLVHAAIRRNSRTHTEFRVPTADSLHVETPFPRLFACGDWVGWDTPSLWMERSTTTAIAAANAVLVTYGCAPFPVLQPDAPEAAVRGLAALVGVGRRVVGGILRVMRPSRTRRSSPR